MDRLLARLERRVGRYAIPNLTAVIVAGMAAVFMLGMVRRDAALWLTLDWGEVMRGEVWRLVTYLFIPRVNSIFWIFFSLSWIYSVGTTLESHWGSFRFNVFYLLACAGTTFAAWLTGQAETNLWINLSLGLAFGTLFPDEEFSFFIIAIKAKWLAVFDAAYIAYALLSGSMAERAAIAAALAAYLIFCGGELLALIRDRNLAVRQGARRAMQDRDVPKPTGARTCAICGASEADGADIRVCSCAKCGGPRTLCLPHARAH